MDDAPRAGTAETQRAFVAGATGYVGRALVRELHGRGLECVAHVRPESRVSPDVFAGAVEVDRSAWEPAELAAALQRHAPTHVFCLIGTTRARMRSEGGSYESIDLGLTRLLVDACTPLERQPRFTYLSSLGVSARAKPAYLRARYAAEQYVIASGLPYTIARSGLITGPDREEHRPLERSGAALMRAPLWIADKLGAHAWRDRYRPIDARELAYGLAHAALNYTTIDRVLQTEELRFETAVHRDYYPPASKRDTHRF